MTDNLSISLLITLIGMGLVFMALILIWGVMAALVSLARETETVTVPEMLEIERKKRAAAAAVAVALATRFDINTPHEFPEPPTAIVSAWQAVMRSNILNKRGRTR